ncbi:hypothetical protein HEQ60_04850 [Haematospirillum sp. H1815]|nr:hypothetical protein [Haematospirillum sp. H1815]
MKHPETCCFVLSPLNPGLVRYGMVLPAGLDIALPDMPPRVAPGEALWG